MIELPYADPGRPDVRSPVGLLLWVGRRQLGMLSAGVVLGIFWMVAQALMPYVLGRAVQDGLVEEDGTALVTWAAALLGLGVVQAVAGVLRHRVAVLNWLQASFRLIQVVAHHAARAGPAVRARLTTGEVVATVSNDALRAGGAFDITARLAGAVVSYVVVAAVLLSASTVLGVVVLVGVPVLVATLGLVIRPLQRRQREQREEVGKLTALGADTVAGLRVLRGIGGEDVFLGRYRERSQQVRRAGVRVAVPQSTLDASQVLLPGIFVVLVTWLGARFAIQGRISPGELVAFYGYAAFLVIPLRTAAEAVDKITRAVVGARRMLDVLEVERVVPDPDAPAPEPPRRRGARGHALGPRRRAGPAHGARLERRPTRPSRSRTGWAASSTTRACRSAASASSTCRSRSCGAGSWSARPTRCSSRARCAPSSTPGDARRTTRRCSPRSRSPNAEDVLDALPEGLDAQVEERGRGFSGGQRQRLALARALLADAEHARARRAHERRRRAHRGARRASPARRARGTDDRRRHREPARARPGRPCRLPGAAAAWSPSAPTASCCAAAAPTATP